MDLPDREVYQALSVALIRRQEGSEQQALAEVRVKTHRDERKKKEATAVHVQERTQVIPGGTGLLSQ